MGGQNAPRNTLPQQEKTLQKGDFMKHVNNQIITGMRRGELPPLTWDDIDFEKGSIYIHREQITLKKAPGNSNKIVEYTKNGKARFYPIADMERVFLEKLKAVHDEYYPNSPFLFPANSENGCITNDTVYQFFRRMSARLDIPINKECVRGTHALRRNAITEVVNQSGGNVVMAAQMFGNSPETIRKHYYTQDSLENKRNVLNRRQNSASAFCQNQVHQQVHQNSEKCTKDLCFSETKKSPGTLINQHSWEPHSER